MKSRSLYSMMQALPDFRCRGKVRHEQAEVLTCFLIGTLAGKRSLRRIRKWCCRKEEELKKYMPLLAGIPSVPTFSRVLAGTDKELLSVTFMEWMEGIVDKNGKHIAIDGKGLRASASKVKGEETPYILNAITADSKLVVGQAGIPEKKNEMSAIPEFLEALGVKGSTITIDAIGTTKRIMEAVCSLGADFVFQVKKNNPEVYQEIQLLMDGLEEEKKSDPGSYAKRHEKYCSSWSGSEKNRERNEYREAVACSAPDAVNCIQEMRPYVNSIGLLQQTRIEIIRDKEGNDITPDLEDFLLHGSKRQPRPKESDEADSPLLKVGLISSRVLNAEEMVKYKRSHWAIENSLHYILDEVLGEDKSTIRKGKENASLLRKAAYNIVRLYMAETHKPEKPGEDDETSFTFALDDITENWKSIAKYIFKPATAC